MQAPVAAVTSSTERGREKRSLLFPRAVLFFNIPGTLNYTPSAIPPDRQIYKIMPDGSWQFS